MKVNDQVAACPCCGALGGSTLAQAPALLAVCDVLVVRALESVGKRVVRAEPGRSRYNKMRGHPWYEAHTLWRPDTRSIDGGLNGCWDVVPAMLAGHGCCNVTAAQVIRMVDDYVRDLLVTGTAHRLPELRYRFEKYLGIELPAEPEPYRPQQDQQPPRPMVVGR